MEEIHRCDVFSLWNVSKNEIQTFIELTNNYHATIKFTAEISDIGITFLDTCVYKGERFKKESKLDVRTNFKPTETFQYTGEGKRRKEFAEWRAEWHNYAKYDLRGE